MAEALSALVAVFLDKLAAVIREEASMGVRSELEALAGTAMLVKSLLADAENKAFHSDAVRLWLKELKDVIHDADDLVEDCNAAAAGDPDDDPAPPSTLSPSSSAGLAFDISLDMSQDMDFDEHEKREDASKVHAFGSSPDIEERKLLSAQHCSSRQCSSLLGHSTTCREGFNITADSYGGSEYDNETVTDSAMPSACQMDVHSVGDPDANVDNDTGGHCCDLAHKANAISSRHDWLDPSFQLNVPLVDVDKINSNI